VAITIDATAGGASANSFLTLAAATTYLEGRLNSSAWTSATTDETNRALVEATRTLSPLGWQGNRTSSTQALSWPRFGAVDPDAVASGFFFASDTVPQRVKDATAELALEFIKAGTVDVAALPSTDGLIAKTIDVLGWEYADPTKRKQGIARYPRVYTLIAPMLESVAGSLRVVRA
jgi:hypothetical protein